MDNNDTILAAVEDKGGGYVWDDVVFAVTLMDVPVSDEDAQPLCKLVGVQQIAIEASRLSFPMLQCLARIPELQSLVLNHSSLTPPQVEALESIGPEIERVNE